MNLGCLFDRVLRVYACLGITAVALLLVLALANWPKLTTVTYVLPEGVIGEATSVKVVNFPSMPGWRRDGAFVRRYDMVPVYVLNGEVALKRPRW